MISTVSLGSETRKADSLFAAGNYLYAGLEYERVVFLTKDAKLKDDCLLKKGYCHKAAGEYADASRTFSRIEKSGKTDSLIFLSRYESALCSFLAGNTSFAEGELHRMKEEIKDTLLRNESLYLEVILLTELEKWELAEQKYLQYCRVKKIDPSAFNLIHSKDDLKLKSEKKALILSLVLPGLGQVYAGKPWRGLSSLLLTGAAVTYGVFSISQGLWFTTFLSGMTFTMRFYAGGAKYARTSVKAYNEQKKIIYKNSVKEMILNTEDKY